MKSLHEIIKIFSLAQFRGEDPVSHEEIVQALWYLRNYEDLLMSLDNVYKDIDYIQKQYQKDLNHEESDENA